MRRLFFALWPEDSLRVRLGKATAAAVAASAGRAVPLQNLHVTLLFIGAVEHARVSDLATLGDHVASTHRSQRSGGVPAVEAAPLVFTQLEYWHRPRVLVATARRAQTSAHCLADGLRSAVTAARFLPDLKPLRPHVTLARKVGHPSPDQPLSPLIWPISGFALVESRTACDGPLYTVLQSFSTSIDGTA